MEIIADTGFIVALSNRSDVHQEAVKRIYYQQQNILIPQTVLAEVAYLVGKEGGTQAVSALLRGLSLSKFSVIALVEVDILRVADILEQYADSPIDM
jgi:predicted nucleic acid-binding protein